MYLSADIKKKKKSYVVTWLYFYFCLNYNLYALSLENTYVLYIICLVFIILFYYVKICIDIDFKQKYHSEFM